MPRSSAKPWANWGFWGPFANAASLPSPLDPELEPGDTAYAQAEASLYTFDGAAWQPVGGGGGTIAGTIAANEVAFGTAPDTIGGSPQLEWNSGTGTLTVSDAAAVPVLQVDTAAGNIDLAPAATGELRINGAPGAAGQVLTSQGALLPPVWGAGGGGGAVFAGALTVYVDPVNGTDAPGGGTLGAPYASINYAYSQVSSLGYNTPGTATGASSTTLVDSSAAWSINQWAGRYVTLLSGTGAGQTRTILSNTATTLTLSAAWTTNPIAGTTYTISNSTSNINQFVTEKLIFQLAPGRYLGNVLLGFKRARVQLIGNGVQIIGNVTLAAKFSDFPVGRMEDIKATLPAPWTGAGALSTFEITGQAGGGVEADATADPLVVTGLSTLLFDEPTIPGTISSGTAWENNFGQFNFYANKAYLIGGMVISTSYVTTPTRGLCASVLEVDSSTIGESANPSRSYFGAVPYAFTTGNTWSVGTGAATSLAAIGGTTLTDSTKGTLGLWTISLAPATVTVWNSAGVSQTRTISSNTTTALTVSAPWTNAIAVGDRYVISTVGTTNKVGEGTITAKVHNSTIGASVGPRIVLGELDGCRIYDLDRTMLGTVDNGSVTGSASTSYIGSVVNQFRQYSGTGIPASQYQLASLSSGARYKIDSTSYTTLAFNRNSSGVLTARTLNFPTDAGTATAGTGTTLTDTSKTWTTGQWVGGTLTLTGGTGAGQSRAITATTANQLTVTPAWTVNPAAGTTYTISAVSFDFQDDARSLAYTPTAPLNWVDPDPSTVGSALDKVATLGLLAAAPANGQIPIGNGVNFTPATLTAGSGITVTNGAGTVTIAATGGGTVTAVTATAPINSTGGATPNISLTGTVGVANGGTGLSATPANGQIPLGNGSGYTLGTLTAGAGITITNASGSVTVAADANAPRMISLDGTATGNAATIIGSVYFPANTALTTAATAYIGGAVVADSTSLTLVPIGGGAPAATWTRSGTLGTQALGAGVTVPAGWYDITLQETVIPPTGSGTAFARGLYLA